ncbi:hypothetical protein BLNAU_3473 [Blattamonas nauphoetae]|uniref:Uncharacterized protein n=1 Tax=Blattamonas nauphoetae TaxID=2049346 RepID=A0ABQ9YD30_9EUKA|nr:hypothetical protein BLNAU_3473 [Blattamonas nauphoetae]
MDDEIPVLLSNRDTSVPHSRKSDSTVNYFQEPFLYFDEHTKLSFEDKSVIYCSLVSLVKAEYPFDNILQNRAVNFLKNLEPESNNKEEADKLFADLVPSSAGSPSGVVESILTLLSSPHSTMVAAALSFLIESTASSSPLVQSRLVESDLITKVLAAIQPHHLPIAENERVLHILIWTVYNCLTLTPPSSLIERDITDAADQYNHREMIFQKALIPSSQFVSSLISNRTHLKGDLFFAFMTLLRMLIRICPFHRPTLEFVLASPIALTFMSCLSFAEKDSDLSGILFDINRSLADWKYQSREVVQLANQMMQALFSEDFEDTIEQMMKHEKSGSFPVSVDKCCYSISKLLGSNVKRL